MAVRARDRVICGAPGRAHSLPCAFVYLFLAHKNLVDVTVQRFAYLVELLQTDPVRHFVVQVVDSRSLIPVSRTRSACVHFLSPRRVDSKILIIDLSPLRRILSNPHGFVRNMVEFGVETVYSNAKISQFIQQKKRGNRSFSTCCDCPSFCCQ